MQDAYDVIVVGGGHNGLVASAYLARAGRRVLVLERRSALGGPIASEEVVPGFRCSTGASLCGLLRPEIIDELDLIRHGLAFLPVDPTVVALGEPGKSLALWRDERKAQLEIAKHSPADAAAYPRFRAFFLDLARVADPLLMREPPQVASLGLGEELFLLRRAFKLRRLGKDAMNQALRAMPMALHDLLGEWFETEILRASFAFDALFGICRGPWSPGTAFGLLHHFLPEATDGAWSFVRGGMSALPQALAAAARDAGVTVRTDAEVRRILSPEGEVTGVELASGETIRARAVVSTADPKRTFLHLADPRVLGADFLWRVRNFNMEGVVAKVNLALNGAPHLAGWDGGLPPRFRVAPTLEYLERAYDDAKHGALSKEPALDVTVPSLVDSTLAPAGKHVMSVDVQYAPYHLRKGSWEDLREDLGEQVVDRLGAYLPDLRGLVVGTEVLTPADLEARFGLTGGHIHHGEMTLNQQSVLRPVPGWGRYRTPIVGLYLCGSGAHPGGGITGAPGYLGARAVLADWPSIAGGRA